MRIIADMADDHRILTALDTGIEQRPGNAHQTDMMDSFHSGLFMEMPTPNHGTKWPKSQESIVLSIPRVLKKFVGLSPKEEEF